MPKSTGPRRQVLARREKEVAVNVKSDSNTGRLKTAQQTLTPTPSTITSSLSVKPLHTKSRPLDAPAPVLGGTAAQAANLHVHSSCEPALYENEGYTIHATQQINYYLDNGTSVSPDHSNLTLTKKFIARGSKSSIDESSIHSVYPPPGHSDYWNTLPHVLFNDPETPWLFETPFKTGDPWLALFVFTHDELYLPDDTLGQISAAVKPPISPTPVVAQTTTLSVPMTNAQFTSLQRASAAPLGSGDKWGTSQTQAIFIPQDLYQAIMPRSQDRSPWLMSHVRTVDTTDMTDMDALDSGTYAVTVAHRTGPINPTTSRAVYAHLVVIPDLTESGRTNVISNKIGLCSLYSWTYTCLPTSGLSVTKCLQDLGDNLQPLRLPTQILRDASSDMAPWVSNRLKAGFSLGRYRLLTGETTMCMFRGMLVPESPYDNNATLSNLPSSDFGSDFAIIDKDSGLVDVTYHMAWTLGRSMAMADRAFCTALMRVRSAIHNESLSATKTRLDKLSAAPVHLPIGDALKGVSSASDSLYSIGRGRNTSNFKSRWQKPSTRPSTRDVYSFAHDDIKTEYKKAHRISAFKLAVAASANPQQLNDAVYDETCPPASTDWATIFAWVLDKWNLGDIPILNLIPDPGFVPKESIRTFYIDPAWLRSLLDGALSVAVHHTDHDDARDAIKDAFEVYLASNLAGKPHPPQLPRFGLFLRSELIQKYPNLHISAPMAGVDTNYNHGDDILRVETLDQDLLVVLFDRIPGMNAFPNGITIQPPGHQLSFTFGNGQWTFSQSSKTVTENWRNVIVPQYNSYPRNLASEGQASNQYSSTSTSATATGYDFQYNTLLPIDLAADAWTATRIGDAKGPLSSLLGTQLIASYPRLQIFDQGTPNLSKPPQRTLPRLGWTCVVDSEEAPMFIGSNVFDSDPISHWHTEWQTKQPDHPHTIDIDLKQTYVTGGLTYLPRQDGSINGNIGQYEIFAMADGNWNIFGSGTWADDTSPKTVTWDDFSTRYIRLKAITEAGGRGPWTSAAEINILGSTTNALPSHSLRTATRAPNQKYPPLVGQDVRPTVPPPPSVPSSSPLELPSYTKAPKLLSLLANTVVSDPDDIGRYFNGDETTNQFPDPHVGWLYLPTYTYNLFTLTSNPNGTQSYKIARPTIPNYPLDFYVSIKYRAGDIAPDPSRILDRIEVLLPYGPYNSEAMLAPLPNYAPSSNPITPSGSLNDAYQDAPHKNPVSGLVLPRVRFLGRGQRYAIRASIVGPGTIYQAQGQILITLTPIMTPSPEVADLEPVSANQDLSFRVEGVALNGPRDGSSNAPRTSIIIATEYYTKWRQDQGWNGKPATEGRCGIEMQAHTYSYDPSF